MNSHTRQAVRRSSPTRSARNVPLYCSLANRWSPGAPLECRQLIHLEIKNEAQAAVDVLQESAAHAPGAFGEKVTIDDDELRHIGDRVFGQPRRLRGQQHVARRVKQAQIRGQDDRDDGADATAIERVSRREKGKSLPRPRRGR